MDIDCYHVKAHSDIEKNNKVDTLCTTKETPTQMGGYKNSTESEILVEELD